MSSLHYYCYKGQADDVEFLIKYRGVDPNEREDDGDRPLCNASGRGHYDVVKVLLQDRRTNVDIRDIGGRTALHRAAAGGHADVVELLLQYGANPGVREHDGDTAYDNALRGYQRARGSKDKQRYVQVLAALRRGC